MDKVQHFEIPADDLARARKFYEKTFGWKTADWSMGEMTYIGLHTGKTDKKNMLKDKNVINGGMFKRGGMFKAMGPVITVVVKDIKKSLQKIKAHGGSIFSDTMSVGGMGLYAYVKDTEGNVIGVWQDVKKAAAKKKKK